MYHTWILWGLKQRTKKLANGAEKFPFQRLFCHSISRVPNISPKKHFSVLLIFFQIKNDFPHCDHVQNKYMLFRCFSCFPIKTLKLPKFDHCSSWVLKNVHHCFQYFQFFRVKVGYSQTFDHSSLLIWTQKITKWKNGKS